MNNFNPLNGLITPAYEIHDQLLAPRGVCLSKQHLIISDTGRNRVTVYKKTSNGFEQLLVLGNNSDQRQPVSNHTFHYPSGVWTNDQQLIVADAWNHRVLIWHQFPQNDFQPADIVIGQPGFASCEPNVYGLGHTPNANTLYWPYGIWSNGQELWIADTGNRRVLYFEKIPTLNFCSASAVIGQSGFEEKDYNPNNAVWPYSVKISENGELLIADTQFFRCLYWKSWNNALYQTADCILGQAQLSDNGQNQYRLLPASNTLNWCYDACFTENGIAVADTGNSRILLHHTPSHSNPTAVGLIGQEKFEVNGDASLSLKLATDNHNHLYWPFAVSYQKGCLAVADTGKSRVRIYNTYPV